MRRALAGCLAAAVTVTMWLTGCDDDFEPASRVVNTRVLGVSVQVTGEPTRATPRAGESADVRFALTGPRTDFDADRIQSLLVRCTFPDRFTGIPICQEFLELLEGDAAADDGPAALGDERFRCEEPLDFAFAGVGLSCQSGPPVIQVPVEPDFTGDGKLVRGVICDGGEPFIDPTLATLFGCEGGDREILVHTEVPVSTGPESDNDNPSLDAIRIELNDVEWTDTEPDLSRDDPNACAEWARRQGLREIDPFTHRIRVTVKRESVEALADGCERLEVRGFATAGEITPEIGVFDGDGCDGDSSQVIEWEGVGLERPDEDGELVDFQFAVRDGRGGFALAQRTACVYTLRAP